MYTILATKCLSQHYNESRFSSKINRNFAYNEYVFLYGSIYPCSHLKMYYTFTKNVILEKAHHLALIDYFRNEEYKTIINESTMQASLQSFCIIMHAL